jgi:L-ascorbate metabolism protein UlaG (beta-lactamase superfamily)
MRPMAGNSFNTVRRWVSRVLMTILAVLAVAAIGLLWIWRDRSSLDDIDWPPYPAIEPSVDAVTMTWLGVTTVLLDDGETQILIDGFMSRPTLLDAVLNRPVDSDAATINYVLDEYRMRRLAAIIPSQSHYDHAMDAGAIANRSSASILGSESTANIARGAGVPEDQIIVASDGGQYRFGNFLITMINSPHAPVGWGGTVPIAGTIDEPLETPTPIWSYREGQSYSIVVEHPHGTILVHGSGGFDDQGLAGIHADVVLLGVGMLEPLGRGYAEAYWQAVVTTTGARHVFAVHFDDFTRPFGEIRLYPRLIDDLAKTSGWLEEFRTRWDSDTKLHLPEFGKTVVLYPVEAPEA